MRSVKLKAGCALGLLGLVALGGVYLSGWLTLKLLGVSAPLKLLTYYEYVKALGLPQVAQYVKKIKLAGAIGFGVPLLGWLLLLIPLFRSREAPSTATPDSPRRPIWPRPVCSRASLRKASFWANSAAITCGSTAPST
jgi:hypothetical protein